MRGGGGARHALRTREEPLTRMASAMPSDLSPSGRGERRRLMSATLEVSALRKQFAIGRPAVDGVSFTVPAGEIVVLLGPSGCGKTTTLRCVAGLEHPSDGSISIAGRVVSEPARGISVAPRHRDLRMVFQ